MPTVAAADITLFRHIHCTYMYVPVVKVVNNTDILYTYKRRGIYTVVT